MGDTTWRKSDCAACPHCMGGQAAGLTCRSTGRQAKRTCRRFPSARRFLAVMLGVLCKFAFNVPSPEMDGRFVFSPLHQRVVLSPAADVGHFSYVSLLAVEALVFVLKLLCFTVC